MAYSWQNTNKKVTGSGNYSWQKGTLEPTLKEKVVTEKQERVSQGLPVSVSKNRATPTVVGSIIRAPLKASANVFSNILGGANLSNKYLGKVEGLGKIDITKAPWEKENLKTVKKSVGTGLELGSYLGGGTGTIGLAKGATKGLVKNLAKEGAISSGIGSIGSQMQDGKITIGQTAKDIAIGTVATPLLGLGFNKIIGKKASKLADEIPTKKVVYSGEPVAKETVGGTKFYTPNKETATKYAEINKDVTGKSQVIEKDISNLNLKKVSQAEMQDALENQDIINNYDGIEFSVAGEKEPSYAIFPEKEKLSTQAEQTFKSELPPEIKRVEVAPETLTKDAEEMGKYIEGFDEGTFKGWSNDLRSLSKEELTNVALGGEKTVKNTIPKTAYYATLKNLAKETKDVNLSQMLANSPVRSKGGQELVANQLSQGENLVDDLIDIKKVRAKQVGISDVRYEKESNDLFNKIKTKIETMKQQIPTIQEVEDIISNVLICK